MTIPVALTIAGSDSGGGAGIQADLKTFHAFGVYGTSAITAITAQNTRGVRAVQSVPEQMVRAQIRAVVEDLPPAAFKTGMLASRGLVRTLADTLRAQELPNYVLDPVMVASSGDRLLDAGAEEAIVLELLPLSTLVTPNLSEAALLTGAPVEGEADMLRAAERLLELGARAVLVKGGHLPGAEIADLLHSGGEAQWFRHARIETGSTHGTGCTLSAAVVAGLAHGRPLATAVIDALDFVHRAIEQAPALGAGHGPLNHFVSAPPAG